jgi:hypothetical protein
VVFRFLTSLGEKSRKIRLRVAPTKIESLVPIHLYCPFSTTILPLITSYNRPYTASDNPHFEAHFKTLQVQPGVSRQVQIDEGRTPVL